MTPEQRALVDGALRARCPHCDHGEQHAASCAFINVGPCHVNLVDVPALCDLADEQEREIERLRSDVPDPQERAILDALRVDLALVNNPSTTFEDAVENGRRGSHWFRLAIDYLSRPR